MVVASVASYIGSHTVVGRIRSVSQGGFEFLLQEEEAQEQAHYEEQVNFLAWEPSGGALDGRRFLVSTAGALDANTSGPGIDHRFRRINFGQGFGGSPAFIADMQTSNGLNVANLRWRHKRADGVEVQVAEEQSLDEEIEHNEEAVGFIVLELAGTEPTPDSAMIRDAGVPIDGGEEPDSGGSTCRVGTPSYMDLEVGQSGSYKTRDGKTHTIKLLSQSLGSLDLSVDGVKSSFTLRSDKCGSTWHQLARKVSGVLVLPEVVSDLQKSCKELEKDRRWSALKVSWETGDKEVDKDVENPGFARLLLADPADKLPASVFPVESTTKTCTALLSAVWRPYLVPSSYGFHHGVDFSLDRGTPIVAARGGTIMKINTTCKENEQTSPTCPGCGNWTEVDDGTFIYQYCHLKTVAESLEVGQKVSTGQYLGESGNTGLSGNVPHLHFTIQRKAGAPPVNQKFYINAYPYLDAWCKKDTCSP